MPGVSPAPNPTPITSASSATTAVSSSADTTLTRKSYASGERHPSSVRPKRDMSHGQSQVFDSRLPSVCRTAPPDALLRALGGHRCRTGRCGFRIEVFPADDPRLAAVLQVVAEGEPGRDVQPDDVLVGHAVEVFHQRAQRV